MRGADEESPLKEDSTDARLTGPIFVTLLGLGFCSSVVQPTLGVLIAPKLVDDPALGYHAVGICQSAFWAGWGLYLLFVMPRLVGRRQPILVASTLGCTAALLSCLATSWVQYGILLFFAGFFAGPTGALCMLMLQESMHPSQWPMVTARLNAAWSLFVVAIAVAGSLMQTPAFSWRAECVLWYTLILAPVAVLGHCFLRKSEQVPDVDEKEEFLFDRTLASLIVVCIASSVGFFGLQYAAGELSPNRFVDMSICGVIDLGSYVFSVFVIKHFGTVKTQTGSMVVATWAFLCASFLHPKSFGMMCITMIGRCAFNFNFSPCQNTPFKHA